MATGDGPRDWQQDDRITFPYARGGIYSYTGRSTAPSSPLGWVGLLAGFVAVVMALFNPRDLAWGAGALGAIAIVAGVLAVRRFVARTTHSIGLPIVGIVFGGVSVVALIVGLVFAASPATSIDVLPPIAGQRLPGPAHPAPSATATALPTSVTFATPSDERAALLRVIPFIGGVLFAISHTSRSMPTSYKVTDQGALFAEPSERYLGLLPPGSRVTWTTDANGRVLVLIIIGPTFGTMIPLNVAAFGGGAAAPTNT
jgi:hypothetical protein